MTTIANLCILAACALPIVCAGLAKSSGWGRRPKDGGYNNRDPRAWLAAQTGRAARANAAQANSFEALPFFMGAVIIAHQLQAPQMRLDILAFLFIFSRLIYILMYLADMANARSLAWTVGLGLNVAIFLAGA